MTLALTALTTILIVAFTECKVRKMATMIYYAPCFLAVCLEISLLIILDALSLECRVPFNVKFKLSCGFLLCVCVPFDLRVHQDLLLTILLPIVLFDKTLLLRVRNECHLLLIDILYAICSRL